MYKGLARVGDLCYGTCHHSSHHEPVDVEGTITTGSDWLIDKNGQMGARLGDTVTSSCGHTGTISTCSSRFIDHNGKGFARKDDLFDGTYVGKIMAGSDHSIVED